MQKLLSCLLSTTLILTSVTPSLAGVPVRQALRGGVVKAASGSAFLPGSRLPASTLTQEMLLKSARISLALPRTSYVLNRQMPVQAMHQAAQLYRVQLAKPETVLSTLPALGQPVTAAQGKSVATLVEDVAGIGLVGVPTKDVAQVLNVYEKSIGTAAEPVMTAVCARALLRLQAYDALEKMSAKSIGQAELWNGIAKYAQEHHLPVTIAPQERATVAATESQPLLQDSGLLSQIVVNPSATSTYFYMNAGIQPVGVTRGATSVVKTPATAQESVAQQPHSSAYQKPALTTKSVSVDPVLFSQEHAFRDQGLSREGLEATYPVYWEDKSTGKTLDVTFQFEDQAAKEAFYNRVDLETDEFFVFDRGTGGIVIRKELTAEEKANNAKAKERGFFKVFFEGGQKTPLALYKVLFAREMVPSFEAATKLHEVKELFAAYRADLRQILSADLLSKYPALKNYLNAKDSVLDKATIELFETEEVMQMAQDITAELKGILATHAGTPVKVYKDDIGHIAQNVTGLAEGTLSTMGQAITAALGLLGIERGSLANLPSSVGQYGPISGPLIGGLADRFGAKKMLGIGQFIGVTGHLTAAASLAAGALGVLTPMQTFGGMVGGILINGVAGTFLKQLNPMIAKQRASDPVSSSTTITDLNSWASVGGMYCYLFLPAAALTTYLATGQWNNSLWAVSAMFTGAATFPLAANLLLRKSRIPNIIKSDAANKEVSGLTKAADAAKSVYNSMKSTVKLGWDSPFLKKMFFATAGGHFMGLGFNSGPGNFIKENITNPSLAMLVSFLSVYLTVFAGRKLGAKAMQKGFIGDRALAGLSGLIGVSVGAASLIPGLDFATRCTLFAAAGLGFANWVNVLQSIELSRPENVGKEASVSSIYMLARLSGALTFLMGMYGDQLGVMLSLSKPTAALYALTLPLAAGFGSMILNRQYITQDLWPTVKRWAISGKNWFKNKLGLGNNTQTPSNEEATAQ